MLISLFKWLLGTLIVLQIIQIKIPPTPQNINPKDEIKAPPQIMSMLKTSCYDCHSYQTHIPWYGHIAPISWEVKSHIKFGRMALNFQEWQQYDEAKKQKLYAKIAETIPFRMPMPMYLTIHKNARLTKEQREQIAQWATKHIPNND